MTALVPWRFCFFVGATLCVACSNKVELFCDEQTLCTDPDRPFCDLEGAFPASEGISNTCIADPFQCETETTVCQNDELMVCGAEGTTRSPCRFGCAAEEERCREMVPSNGLKPLLGSAASAPDLVLLDGSTIDTSTGIIVNGDGAVAEVPTVLLEAPNDGVSVRVFMAHSLTMGDTIASGEPALAFVVAEEFELVGALGTGFPIPGEASSVADCVAGDAPPSDAAQCGGGGGGGFGTSGGGSGSATMRAGPPAGNESIEPLRGGCRGGVGAGALDQAPSPGGLGGGAVQIVGGTSIRIGSGGAGGSVLVPGGGAVQVGQECSSGGGGSGGAILLEAPEIVVSAVSTLAANGGGGSCATDSGENGSADATPALGGACSIASGGDGAAGAVPPEMGDPGNPLAGLGSAGGGGGAGRIRLNTFDDSPEIHAAATISPPPSTGTLRTK